MIVNLGGYSATDLILPAYLGTDLAGVHIIGIGRENAFVVKEAIEIVGLYHRALLAESVSIVEERAQLPRTVQSHVHTSIQRQLDALKAMPEADDLGRIRPSPHGIRTSNELLFRMAQLETRIEAPADVCTDHDGAIRIVWEKDERTVELVVPFEATGRPYIYFAEGPQYRIAHDLSIYRLGRLHAWLNGRERVFPR